VTGRQGSNAPTEHAVILEMIFANEARAVGSFMCGVPPRFRIRQ
jgi:hypothetical protein